MASLATYTPAHTYDPTAAASHIGSKSLLSTILPNLQGQGPIGNIFRILVKLHYNFQQFASSLGREAMGTGNKRKEDDLRGKAIKVMDLLQHSAELGNMDALFTLGKVSLVGPCSLL